MIFSKKPANQIKSDESKKKKKIGKINIFIYAFGPNRSNRFKKLKRRRRRRRKYVHHYKESNDFSTCPANIRIGEARRGEARRSS